MHRSGRGRQWRRRGGSHRYSFMSNASEESQRTFADAEEEFLHASEFGDIPGVKRLLQDFPDLNTDCIDALGRTALRLAVKNEHLEIVEVLLERSNQHHIYEAVLQAISAGHIQIAETILKHRRYLEMWRERRKLGDIDGFFKTVYAESQFSPDVTPLMLASHKNQYEIVQLLLLRGETILKPHKFGCACTECQNKMKFDQLRMAKYRVNAYKGLASEAYISLSSKDPILTAFELAKELKNLSRVEKHFKREYKELVDQLSEYGVKLLDRLRTQEELDFVLNKTGRSHVEKYETFARFKLALQYKEKKFVAHPSCQQRLVRMWYSGLGKFERSSWNRRLMALILFILLYPFLVLIYIIAPGSKAGKVLQYPFVKFVCHSLSFVAFLSVIIISTIESSNSVSKQRTLGSTYPNDLQRYLELRNASNSDLFGHDFPLRAYTPTVTQIILSLYILGFLCQECSQVYNNGLMQHIQNLFNLMDFMLISVYTSVFTLNYFTMIKFHLAINYVEGKNLTMDLDRTRDNLYWLNADRMFWKTGDPIHVAEGLFAVANILSFSRIVYILPANEGLGPLQISLARMLKDILKFAALFCLVILAFMVGLHNLFWYYSARHEIEVIQRNLTIQAEESFGDAFATFRTVFWSLFGRGEPTVVQLGAYNNNLTQDVGYIIYGSYNIVMVTVLLNMLIAMMTRSFTNIAEDSDVEWKFSRSLLYMEYIADGSTLPVPLNIIHAPKSAIRSIFCKCGCDDKEEETPPPKNEESVTRVPLKSFKHRPMLDGPTGAANPVSEVTAVEMYEANAKNGSERSVNRTQSKPSVVPSPDEKLTYQKVMQRVVQRYIFDIQREAEVTEDDFEEIKQDISSFRYEMLNQWLTRESVQNTIATNINAIIKEMESLRSELKSSGKPREKN